MEKGNELEQELNKELSNLEETGSEDANHYKSKVNSAKKLLMNIIPRYRKINSSKKPTESEFQGIEKTCLKYYNPGYERAIGIPGRLRRGFGQFL